MSWYACGSDFCKRMKRCSIVCCSVPRRGTIRDSEGTLIALFRSEKQSAEK